jgi:glycosyltransferase involved in cell wall biosynthesis
MASGTAILSSPNGGASFVLDGETYGWIRPDDQFASALLQLLDDASVRNDLAKKGLDRASAFTWTKVAEQHRVLYQEAISAFHPTSSTREPAPVS